MICDWGLYRNSKIHSFQSTSLVGLGRDMYAIGSVHSLQHVILITLPSVHTLFIGRS